MEGHSETQVLEEDKKFGEKQETQFVEEPSQTQPEQATQMFPEG